MPVRWAGCRLPAYPVRGGPGIIRLRQHRQRMPFQLCQGLVLDLLRETLGRVGSVEAVQARRLRLRLGLPRHLGRGQERGREGRAGRMRSLHCRRLRNRRQQSLDTGAVRLGEILVGQKARGLAGVDLDRDRRVVVVVEVEGLDKDNSSMRRRRSKLAVVGGRRRIRSRCWLLGDKGRAIDRFERVLLSTRVKDGDAVIGEGF